MKLAYTFAIQPVGEHYVAVAINEDADRYKNIIQLNQTGKRVFEILAEEHTLEEVIAIIQREFEGESDYIAKEITSYIQSLHEAGLLKE